jgi:hypothetical protein
MASRNLFRSILFSPVLKLLYLTLHSCSNTRFVLHLLSELYNSAVRHTVLNYAQYKFFSNVSGQVKGQVCRWTRGRVRSKYITLD